MSDFLNILREREVPDWLRAAYGLVFLIALAHAVVTKDALTCCPPGYTDADILTFVHCVQSAVGWTLVVIAIVEVTTVMVFMVPKVYYGIKEKGEREGAVRGREEGRKEGIAEGVEKGKAAGVDDTLAAMREAGFDDETLRRVEDTLARRAARRNGS